MSDTATRSIVDDAIAAFEQHSRKVLESNEEVTRENLRVLRQEACEVVEKTLGITTLPTSWEYQSDSLITFPLHDRGRSLGYCDVDRWDFTERRLFLVDRCSVCKQ